MTPFDASGKGKKPLENIVGKGEIACTMFCTLSETKIIIFVTFIICKCFEFGLVQNFVVFFLLGKIFLLGMMCNT